MKKLSLAAILTATTFLTPAYADIVSSVGLTTEIAPSVVGQSFVINDNLPHQIIFGEQLGITLANALVTDTGIIAAGTRVDSYFFAVNAPGNQETVVDTSVTFSNAVLGLIFQEDATTGTPSPNFLTSDFLGPLGTTYDLGINCQFCGFENANQTQINADAAHFSGNTAFFHNDYSIPGDFARIIVADPVGVPGPIAGAGLPGLLAGLMGVWGWWRRRNARALV